MAEIEEVVKVTTKTTGTESVKSLKQEIREAQNEATKIAREFGAFSKEATTAAQRVAHLRDEMEDFKERVAGLNPDKFKAIAGVVQGVAGGIAAAQGAMAIFGDTSEETAKTLAKVQGAIAFSQGVQQILDLKNSFGAMAGVIKTQVVTAFSTLKGAIAATGIGLLIIAIGIAIEKMQALGEESEKTAKKIEDSLKFIEDVTKKNELDLTRDINAAKLRGASEDELDKIRSRNYQRRVELIKDERAKNEDKSKFDALLVDESIKAENFIFGVKDRHLKEQKAAQDKFNTEAEAARKEELANEIAYQKEREAMFAKIQEDLKAKQENAANVQREIEDNLRTLGFNAREKERDDLTKWYDEKATALSNAGASLLDLQDLYAQKQQALTDKYLAEDKAKQEKEDVEKLAKQKEVNDKSIAEEKRKNDAIAAGKKQAEELSFSATSSALNSLSQLYGRATAEGKAFAIAQIAIDAAKGISGAVAGASAAASAGGPAAPFLLVGYLASGIATVLSGILAAKQALSGATPSATPSTGSAIFNPNVSFSKGSDEIAGHINDSKVFVLEGDISRSQKNVNRNRAISVY